MSSFSLAEPLVANPIKVEFQVHAKGDQTPTYESNNFVYIVGSEPGLGDWFPSKAVQMSRMVNQDHKDGGMVWRAEVTFPASCRIHYRYFVGRPSAAIENVIIEKWEGFASPRTLHVKQSLAKASPKQVPPPMVVNDSLGKYAQYTCFDHAWLTSQMEIRISFLKNPITWWKKRHQTQKYSMKVSATDPKGALETTVETSPSLDSLQDYAMINEENEGILGPVRCAVLTEIVRDKDGKEKQGGEKEKPFGYHTQGQFGIPLTTDENLIFKVQSEDPQKLYFTIDFFVLDHPKSLENAPYFAGTSHILYSNFTSEEDQIICPIFGRNSKPIGQATFTYLVIRPLQSATLDMEVSRFYHWTLGSPTVDVGHRGMGTSYKYEPGQMSGTYTRENTIKSLNDAAESGADFVEFDVQLTRDKIPVIYHDFSLKVNLRKRVLNNMDDRKDGNFALCSLSVKDLTIRQLQSLQTYHSSVEEHGARDWRTDPTAANADEPEDLLPFPTLEKTLDAVEDSLGFNVEIKYPQFIDHGDILEHEQVHFYDRNDYLDRILAVLMQHGRDRRIIISCFDSDACIMLRNKQNRFPVLFLTQGQSQKWPPYKDFRTLSIPAAVKFACSEQLIGINVHTEDLLREGALITEVKHSGLVLFCWGEDNNNQDNIQYLKSHGVDGIIYDRINEFIHPAKAAKAKALLKAQTRARAKSMNLNKEKNPDAESEHSSIKVGRFETTERIHKQARIAAF